VGGQQHLEKLTLQGATLMAGGRVAAVGEANITGSDINGRYVYQDLTSYSAVRSVNYKSAVQIATHAMPSLTQSENNTNNKHRQDKYDNALRKMTNIE